MSARVQWAKRKRFSVSAIHGRGIGVQCERVRALLASHPGVVSFVDAPADRGHWGATVVRLRVAPPPG